MKRQRILQGILRIVGCTGALAYPCALFPYAWMNAVHQWAGLGELPGDPIVGYLSRSLSFFYGMSSTLLLICSTDIPRYRPLIRTSGALITALGTLLLTYDCTGGMPVWWTSIEGVPTIAMGAAIWWMARATDPR